MSRFLENFLLSSILLVLILNVFSYVLNVNVLKVFPADDSLETSQRILPNYSLVRIKTKHYRNVISVNNITV